MAQTEEVSRFLAGAAKTIAGIRYCWLVTEAKNGGLNARPMGRLLIATARDIAGRSPDAIRAAKRLLNGAVACDASAGLAAERTEQRGLIGRPNHVEAVNANLEKRLPRFVDPIGSQT